MFVPTALSVLKTPLTHAGSSGGNASDCNADVKGFVLHTGRQFLGLPSLDGYWSMTRRLTTAERGHSEKKTSVPDPMGENNC